MEIARSIKCEEEIKAMRCAIVACDRSIDIMKAHMVPGVSEQRLWSYLHAENIARGGEWIETRIMASVRDTNPWFQEL
jgi:Xaa-Pro aminopeptidase